MTPLQALYVDRQTGQLVLMLFDLGYDYASSSALRVFVGIGGSVAGTVFSMPVAAFDERFDNYTPRG